jgi:putative redox protein
MKQYRMQLDDGRHQWQADVSAAAGGEDSSPTPFDMLTAAIAACKCFVTRRYADNSGLPVEAVEVQVDGAFADPDDPATFGLKAVIRVKGDLDDKALKRLLRAAETCPVRKAVEALHSFPAEITRM